MIVSQATISKISDLIESNYTLLATTLLDLPFRDSLIALAYYHSFSTPHTDSKPPTNIPEAEAKLAQRGMRPTGDAANFAVESSERHVRTFLEQLKNTTKARVEAKIRNTNDRYKSNALQHVRRSEIQDDLVKESFIGGLKDELGEVGKKADEEYKRMTLTELSNATGTASVDRIIDDHMNESSGDVDTSEIYCYRIPVQDSITCVFCRSFYGDVGETPKIYRLQTLLANGSNLGLPRASWAPVVGATHYNSRTSQIIEIPKGYVVLPGGSLDFVGEETATLWLNAHLED